MEETSNYQKNTTGNPISRFFLNNFYIVLRDEIKKIKPQSILDAGCGEGFTLARLQKDKVCKKLEGMEFLDTAIELGKKLSGFKDVYEGCCSNSRL